MYRRPFLFTVCAALLVALFCNNAALAQKKKRRDILAIPVTGAYGQSMGSNYNKVLRPAVLFVADGKARLVVRRETYDDLLRADLG